MLWILRHFSKWFNRKREMPTDKFGSPSFPRVKNWVLFLKKGLSWSLLLHINYINYIYIYFSLRIGGGKIPFPHWDLNKHSSQKCLKNELRCKIMIDFTLSMDDFSCVQETHYVYLINKLVKLRKSVETYQSRGQVRPKHTEAQGSYHKHNGMWDLQTILRGPR